MTNPFPTNKSRHPTGWWSGSLASGLLAYVLTSALVVLGVSFGHQFVAPPAEAAGRSFLEGFSAGEGGWYQTVAASGYNYDPNKRSTVAFFPLFPLLGTGVIRLTGLKPTWALLVVSHVCLVAAFVIATIYLRGRRPMADPTITSLTLLALGLMPATFFFRMAYSESTFLLLSLLFLLGLQRDWPLIVVALVAGLASAARPVGVSLLLPLLVYTWRRSPSCRAFLGRTAFAVPLACWGLLAYAAFLNAQFDEPLAFVQTQTHWGSKAPSLGAKLLALSSYEPIWEIFLRGPVAGWSVFSWERVNPVYFVTSAALVVIGAWRGWLNAYESSLAAALLLIPYLTRAYEMHMGSSARFAAVVFPVYLVLGEGLNRLPLIASIALLAISAFFLGAFSALFAGGYPIF